MSALGFLGVLLAVCLLFGAFCTITRGGALIAALASLPVGLCVIVAGLVRVLR